MLRKDPEMTSRVDFTNTSRHSIRLIPFSPALTQFESQLSKPSFSDTRSCSYCRQSPLLGSMARRPVSISALLPKPAEVKTLHCHQVLLTALGRSWPCPIRPYPIRSSVLHGDRLGSLTTCFRLLLSRCSSLSEHVLDRAPVGLTDHVLHLLLRQPLELLVSVLVPAKVCLAGHDASLHKENLLAILFPHAPLLASSCDSGCRHKTVSGQGAGNRAAVFLGVVTDGVVADEESVHRQTLRIAVNSVLWESPAALLVLHHELSLRTFYALLLFFFLLALHIHDRSTLGIPYQPLDSAVFLTRIFRFHSSSPGAFSKEVRLRVRRGGRERRGEVSTRYAFAGADEVTGGLGFVADGAGAACSDVAAAVDAVRRDMRERHDVQTVSRESGPEGSLLEDIHFELYPDNTLAFFLRGKAKTTLAIPLHNFLHKSLSPLTLIMSRSLMRRLRKNAPKERG
ncbi:hypothetical protein KC316_g77 [Hortaea werneckii]|nr:hypothetical protein KC316_g77 [Hortaea werneckii]